MLRLAFDFIITWGETRTRPNAYELALIFCLTNNDLLNVIKKVCDLYPSEIVFSDVAGIKELQFRTTINSIDVLNRYYEAN